MEEGVYGVTVGLLFAGYVDRIFVVFCCVILASGSICSGVFVTQSFGLFLFAVLFF